MKSNESRNGDIGWGLLWVGIAAWDVLADETLTHAFDRYMHHPVKRVLAVGALAITAGHLLDVIPDQLDPIHQIGKAADWIADHCIDIDLDFSSTE